MSKLLDKFLYSYHHHPWMASIMQNRKNLTEKKRFVPHRKKGVDGMVGISLLVQGNVRNGIVLLLTWVKWSLILLKNRALGEKEWGEWHEFEEKFVILQSK